jgi:hypothetical protein
LCVGIYTSRAVVGVREEIGEILLHICPRTATYVSSYRYICVPDNISGPLLLSTSEPFERSVAAQFHSLTHTTVTRTPTATNEMTRARLHKTPVLCTTSIKIYGRSAAGKDRQGRAAQNGGRGESDGQQQLEHSSSGNGRNGGGELRPEYNTCIKQKLYFEL